MFENAKPGEVALYPSSADTCTAILQDLGPIPKT